MSKGWILFVALFAAAPAWAQDEPAAAPATTESAEATAEPAADVAEAVLDEAAASAETTETGPEWEASCGIGGSMSGGNTRFGSVAGDCRIARESGKIRVQLDGAGHFGRTRYGGIGNYASGLPITEGSFIVTQKDYMASLREDYYAREDKRTFLFSVQEFKSNEFAGYDWRIAVEAGGGYLYVKNDKQEHGFEAGAEYEFENGVVSGEDEHRYGFGAGIFGETIFSERSLLGYEARYRPSFTERDDWRALLATYFNFRINDWLAYKTGLRVDFDKQPSMIEPYGPDGNKIAGLTVSAKKTDVLWTNQLTITIF
ncbi:MAG: DUF481 domain-containing protein [Candidatus Dadabacteria bacterium]|nr:MAG: DUF481 domain-containing protein [Candidatus Dadabacteria bacterium]